MALKIRKSGSSTYIGNIDYFPDQGNLLTIGDEVYLKTGSVQTDASIYPKATPFNGFIQTSSSSTSVNDDIQITDVVKYGNWYYAATEVGVYLIHQSTYSASRRGYSVGENAICLDEQSNTWWVSNQSLNQIIKTDGSFDGFQYNTTTAYNLGTYPGNGQIKGLESLNGFIYCLVGGDVYKFSYNETTDAVVYENEQWSVGTPSSYARSLFYRDDRFYIVDTYYNKIIEYDTNFNKTGVEIIDFNGTAVCGDTTSKTDKLIGFENFNVDLSIYTYETYVGTPVLIKESETNLPYYVRVK